MQRVWVWNTLLDMLPLYLSFIKRKKSNILQQECYYIGESKNGAKGRLGTNYIQ
jgi:hypothetical protein